MISLQQLVDWIVARRWAGLAFAIATALLWIAFTRTESLTGLLVTLVFAWIALMTAVKAARNASHLNPLPKDDDHG